MSFSITQSLLHAYQSTHYHVDHPLGRFTLRIGTPSQRARELLIACGAAAGQGGLFITVL